jgi:hypothetical protein
LNNSNKLFNKIFYKNKLTQKPANLQEKSIINTKFGYKTNKILGFNNSDRQDETDNVLFKIHSNAEEKFSRDRPDFLFDALVKIQAPKSPMNYLFIEYLNFIAQKFEFKVSFIKKYLNLINKYIKKAKPTIYHVKYLNVFDDESATRVASMVSTHTKNIIENLIDTGFLATFNVSPMKGLSYLYYSGSEEYNFSTNNEVNVLGTKFCVCYDDNNCSGAVCSYIIPTLLENRFSRVFLEKNNDITEIKVVPMNYAQLILNVLDMGMKNTNLALKANQQTANALIPPIPYAAQVQITPTGFAYWDLKHEVCWQIANFNMLDFANFYGYEIEQRNRTTINIIPQGQFRVSAQALELDPRASYSGQYYYWISTDLVRTRIANAKIIKNRTNAFKKYDNESLINFQAEIAFYDKNFNRNRKILLVATLINENVTENMTSNVEQLNFNLGLEKVIPFITQPM